MATKYVVKPKIKGFICTTAHPIGCAAHVEEQLSHVKAFSGPKNVLIIGASTGYGLASRIVAAFGSRANTLGVFFERPAQGERTASAGWYNTVAFHNAVEKHGLPAKSISINGDAFSDDIKEKTIETIRHCMGSVDLVIYSLASPRRTHPKTGKIFHSALKPIGKVFHGKTVNTDKGIIQDISIEPATAEEIEGTIAVMGGEDWLLWMEALSSAKVLSGEVKTVAYSYIGPSLTWDIYKNGTIGRAKEDLDQALQKINKILKPLGGIAHISVNKAVVTQASSAIPVVPLYISCLFKIMKEKNLHEDCIQQMQRLFAQNLYHEGAVNLDSSGRIRIDDWEMRPDVQTAVSELWPQLTTENLFQLTDFASYEKNFLALFGFGCGNIDYDEPVETEIYHGDMK